LLWLLVAWLVAWLVATLLLLLLLLLGLHQNFLHLLLKRPELRSDGGLQSPNRGLDSVQS
jgi:hypothetical protein